MLNSDKEKEIKQKNVRFFIILINEIIKEVDLEIDKLDISDYEKKMFKDLANLGLASAYFLFILKILENKEV